MFTCKYVLPVLVFLSGVLGCAFGLKTASGDLFLFSLFGTIFFFLIDFFALFMKYAWKKNLFHALDQILFASSKTRQKSILYLFIALLILICILPMGLSPYWNGQKPQHRDQYEIMADSILDGHLYMDLYVDPILTSLENPYNLQARKDSGAYYYWDHAFYNQHYYMYFGVVPVFLTFIPYRLITGSPLTTYHATQLYAALIIIGTFALFALLVKRFFRSLSFGRYMALSASFSVISIWFSVGFPSLYCTAITCAICLMIWSLYFFVRAVFISPTENRQILCAFVGSLLGALAFGCRPPIALANLLVLPLLITYLKGRKFTLRLFFKLLVAAFPYLVIAILLMVYNYLRFDNPFEFGQSYQLTVTDQSQYIHSLSTFNAGQTLTSLLSNFFAPLFPPKYGGAFMNFPLLLSVFGVFSPSVRNTLKAHRLHHFAYGLFLVPIVITFMDIMWSPYLLERYRMDIYFLMGILSFLVLCCYSTQASKNSRVYDFLTFGLPLFSVFTCAILFLIPHDYNFTHYAILAIQRRLSSPL